MIQKKHVFKRESPTSGQKYTVLDLLRKINERAKTYGTIHISEKLFMDEEYYNYDLLVFVDIHVSESTWGFSIPGINFKGLFPIHVTSKEKPVLQFTGNYDNEPSKKIKFEDLVNQFGLQMRTIDECIPLFKNFELSNYPNIDTVTALVISKMIYLIGTTYLSDNIEVTPGVSLEKIEQMVNVSMLPTVIEPGQTEAEKQFTNKLLKSAE